MFASSMRVSAGTPTEMARKRFEKDVLSHQPQIAILQFGIDDSAVDVWKTPSVTEPRVTLERYEANLRHFVQTLKSKNTRVVLMTSESAALDAEAEGDVWQASLPARERGRIQHPARALLRSRPQSRAGGRVELLDMQQAFVEQAQKKGVTVDTFLSDGMHPNDRGPSH